MPELPDVETFRKYLDETSLRQMIREVSITDRRILEGVSRRKLVEALTGNRFEGTERHGKFLFARLRKGGWLVLHFGMTGYLEYFKEDSRDPPRHARLLLRFAGGSTLAYISQRLLGRVTLAGDVQAFCEAQGLGPDALAEDLKSDDLRRGLSRRRGAIKSALMDQSLLAGVGNVYADEALFQAGIRPTRRAERVDDEETRRLFRTLRRVLRVVARHRVRLDELPRGYLLPVREGDRVRCPRCSGTLRKTRVSGRTTYFCGRCQS